MRWRTAFSLLLLALVRARAWSQDGCRADPYSDSACPAYTRLVRGRDCLVYRAAEWGLGSQLVHLLHAVKNVGADRLYFDFSASPYKCCPATGECPDAGWSTLFEGNVPLLPPPASHLLHLNDHTVAFADAAGRNVSCYRLSLNDVADFNRWHVNGAQPVLDGLCDPLLSLWHLSRTPRAVVHHEVLALKHYPQPVVVLQVRGGDKLAHEVAGGGYTFEPALDKLAANASLRGGTCVVLGDDSAMGATAAEAAIRLLNCQVVNRIEPAYQHFQDNFTREGPVSKCWRTEKLLADIEIMAASDAALVLMASNVARIAVLLRECRRPGALREVLDWQGHNVLFEACLAA